MKSYEAWLDRARSALELGRVTMIHHIQFRYEDLCFQLQQAVEKAVKGLLIYHGVEPEFTHNIEVLIEELEKIMEVPEKVKHSAELTIYAVTTRYPGEYDEVTKEQYERSVKIAETCVEWVESTVKESEAGKKAE